ncbi:MAG: hypothetical protein J2P17_12755, partial [Mycobacterium sp.]|nr:hypothetical protein [Mycobacterium sp.]
TNTAVHGYSYTYDPDGQQTGISDTSPGAAVGSYITAYDQDGRTTSVTEKNSSGTTLHTTTYGWDADSNESSMTHDGAPSAYEYTTLEQLSKETDAKSSSDASPQVSTFTYNPVGQVQHVVKPNSNTVDSTYYANSLPYTVTEKTSGGTLVSSHQYSYDPDGNTAQNTEQLMSADTSSSYLSHTLTYTYSPADQVSTVKTDGTVTESYTHDASNNVTAQTVNGTSTTYGYADGRLVTATAGGSTADYNYDPFGRLDTVTAAGTGQTIQSSTYDGFDHLQSTTQLTSSGSMASTSYTYDSLNRMATQTTSGTGTTSFSYLGTTSEVASESDPGGASKTYDYTPGGGRLSQTATSSTGTTTPGYYSYNAHSDVEALTGTNGTTTSTYGYTAYGQPVTGMFTGQDKNTATSKPDSTSQPQSSYRYNSMRWDGTSGQYDMGFRNYDPGLNQFTTRDMYNGAAADTGLTANPFTGGQYAFGNGNPISNIEYDGHSIIDAIENGVKSLISQLPGAAAAAGGGTASSGTGTNVDPASVIGAGIVKGFASMADGIANALPDILQLSQQQSGGASLPPLWHVNLAGAWDSWAQKKLGYAPGSDDAKLANVSNDFTQIGTLFTGIGDAARAVGLIGKAADAADAARGADASSGLSRLARGCLGGQSFTAGTKVLLANGTTKAISSLKPGDKVLATNTKTGKTSPEAVSAVEVNHDHDLYDLKVKVHGRDTVIHTTAGHLFWDLRLKQWRPASKLTKDEHLKTANGTAAVADGGTTPKDHDGWMWDITVPGNNDHDFYVIPGIGVDGEHDIVGHYLHYTETGNTPVLVHNSGCSEFVNTYDSPGGANGIIASVDSNGILNTVITAGEGTPKGSVMFQDAMDALGSNVQGIRGKWLSGSGELQDNLDSFNAGIQNGLTPQEAALNTFTGKMAVQNGFTNVTIENTVGPMGEYTSASVVFTR